jgi:signal transduction histidine kinase
MSQRTRKTAMSQLNCRFLSTIAGFLPARIVLVISLVVFCGVPNSSVVLAASGLQPIEVVSANSSSIIAWFAPPASSSSQLFCALCACMVGGLLWQLYRLRLASTAQQSRSRTAGMLEERERIARELHDTLVQSVHALILTLQTSIAHLPRTDGVRQPIEAALDTAADLLDEARDRVNGLRMSSVALDLAGAIANAVHHAQTVSKFARIRLVVSGTPQRLQQSAAEQIYSVTREALANAVAHANARHIEVEVGYQKHHVRVQVRDDGRGMAPVAQIQSATSRHFGLQGMRERADQLGAQLTIWSRENEGTEIGLQVPDTSAYLFTAPIKGRLQGFADAVETEPHFSGHLMSWAKHIAGAAQRHAKEQEVRTQ